MNCKKCNAESGNHELCSKCYASNQKMTEGEEVIKEFLEEEGINYKFQKEITSLQNDEKEFRLADFYLPRYKVYIEFLGKWNNPLNKEKYKKKMGVYTKNNIPCIYLYPENLGILNKILKRRIKKVLQSHQKLKWQLFKLNWDIFGEKFGITGLVLIGLIFYVPEILWKSLFSIALLGVIFASFKDSFFRKID